MDLQRSFKGGRIIKVVKSRSANTNCFMQAGLDKHCSTLFLSSTNIFNQQRARAHGIIPNLHKGLFVAGNVEQQYSKTICEALKGLSTYSQ